MKKYLVTGATGFIGSNLVRTLLKRGMHAAVLIEPSSNTWRLDALFPLETYYADLLSPQSVRDALFRCKPDVVFHLASYGNMAYHRDTEKSVEVNLLGTAHLVDACLDTDVEVVVNAGSFVEYGRKDIPLHEEMMPEPLTTYGISKVGSTLYCAKTAKLHRVPYYTLRIFNVYGPYEPLPRLIPSIASHLFQRTPLYFSSPQAKRDFIYVEDVVAAFLTISQKKPKDAYVFNVGTGVETTLQEIVKITEDITNMKLEPAWGMERERSWEPLCAAADMKLTSELVQWLPLHDLRMGLERTYEWYEKHPHLYQHLVRGTDCSTPPLAQ